MPTPRYNPHDRPCRRPPLAALAALALAVLPGCGEEPVQFTIDEQELGRITEELVELELGEYEVPIPVAYVDDDSQTRYKNAFLFRFRLDALVEPREAGSTRRLMDRRSGALKDRVMTTCRNSGVAELLDPQLTALRARLLEEIQPLFDGHLLRRLVITDVLSDPL